MEILEIVKAGDGYVALAIAVWVIQSGMAQMRDLITQYNNFVATVLTQQQDNNQSLANLVKDLCSK